MNRYRNLALAFTIVIVNPITQEAENSSAFPFFVTPDRWPGTYLEELFKIRNQQVVRWPIALLTRNFYIWIAPILTTGDSVLDVAHVRAVKESFSEWNKVRIPLLFVFTSDSSKADVKLQWVSNFEEKTIGKVLWKHNPKNGHMLKASIQIAIRRSDQTLLDTITMKAISLHEIGHMTGLEHTRQDRTIMQTPIKIAHLDPRDQVSAQILYSMPFSIARK